MNKVSIKILGYFLAIILLSVTNITAQHLTKGKRMSMAVSPNALIELTSTATNIEFELTDKDSVSVEAILQIEGLNQQEVDAYFQKWDYKLLQANNKIIIHSFLEEEAADIQHYDKGYFFGPSYQEMIDTDMQTLNKESSPKPSLKNNGDAFDYDAYIEHGDAYLLKWEKEHNENIGRRWFNKTKKERIAMQQQKKDSRPKQSPKERLGQKSSAMPKGELIHKQKQRALPKVNIRATPKRAEILKTLKISIPKKSRLSINARYGRMIFHDEIVNLTADLHHTLLKANKVLGKSTSIKGKYANFEIDNWQEGSLDISFSNYALIKQVNSIYLTSNTSVVSIDNITENITAKGSFKLLDLNIASTIRHADLAIEDSRKVWIKFPQSPYNFHYEGVHTKLIHPNQFMLKKAVSNSSTITHTPLPTNEHEIRIKSAFSIMQIYDIPWEDLKIKDLTKIGLE